MLSTEDLLAGSRLSFDIELPPDVLNPVADRPGADNRSAPVKTGKVRLRPLTMADLQIISRAARDNDSLLAVLMVQKSLQEPALTVAEVSGLHLGLMKYLLDQVHQISGLDSDNRRLSDMAEEPMARAAFLLSQEFGWTPQQISELTLGQILLHLQMMNNRESA
jgi:hypothetical protein